MKYKCDQREPSPPIQDGVHTNVEYDTKKASLERHKKVDLENDPDARNKFYLIE